MKKIFFLGLLSIAPLSLGSAQANRLRSSIEIYAYGSIDPLKGSISLKFAAGAHNNTTVIESLFKPTSILAVQEDAEEKEKVCFPSAALKSEYEIVMQEIAKKISPELQKSGKLIFGVLTSGEVNIEPYLPESKS